MSFRFAVAFCLAAWLTLLGCGGLRSEARRARRARRVSPRWEALLRRLGGPVVAAATLAGWIATPSPPGWLAAVAAGAVALCVLALIAERQRRGEWLRLGVIVAAAVLVVAAGVQAAPFGEDGLDVVVTVLWIVLVTEAVRRVDHADGLAPGLIALAALGMFAIAAPDDAVTAVLTVSLAGAAVAMLAYNSPPASIGLGAAGAMFAGFVVAVGGVEIEPRTEGAEGLLVPFLLIAIPLLDWLMVNVSRAWHGLPLSRSRRDHLFHNLARSGLSRGQSLVALLGAQAIISLAAVLVAYDLISPFLGVGAAVAVLLVVAFRALEGARPPSRGAEKARGPLVVTVCAIAGALLILGALAAFDGLRELRSAQAALDAALDAGRDGDAEAARIEFLEASEAFEHAHGRLNGPFLWFARGLPIVSENLRAARQLSDTGAEVSEAGAKLATAGGERLQVVAGVVRIDEVRRLTPDIEAAAELVRTSAERIEDIRRSYLLGPVRDRVDEAYDELTQAAGEARRAVAAAHIAPAIFGGDGTRHYFLGAQNNAELRGTGGIMGNWGILTVDDGDVELEEFERAALFNDETFTSLRSLDAAPDDYVERYGRFAPGQILQNVNMTPDFPTVGTVINELYPQARGGTIDGVIGVDPVGLQALLELTGPVTLPEWPAPITADNVIDVTLKEQYEAFEDTEGEREEREEFLGDVTEAVWETATQIDLGNPARIARVLGDVAREGHLSLWFSRPEEQELAAELGVTGEVPAIESDSVLVTAQNGAANKVDYYLNRQVDYQIQLNPASGRRSARVEGSVEVRLDNGAPAGISSFALGPWDERFEPGENHTFVSLYTPLALQGATLEGLPLGLESGTELGRNVFSTFVSVPADSSRTLEANLAGTVRLEDGGWYELDLVRQPTLHADSVGVSIEVPEGWRIVDVRGAEPVTPRRVVEQLVLHKNREIRVRIERA